MSIRIKDNGDGTGYIKNGNTVVATITADGTIKPVRKTLAWSIVGGLFEADVPSWATRIKLFMRNVVPAAAATPTLLFYDGGVLTNTGFRSTCTAGIAASSTITEVFTGGGAAGHPVGPNGSISASVTLFSAIVTIEKVGDILHTQSQMMRSDGNNYLAISEGTVNNLTRIRFATGGASWNSGSITALFE